MTVIICDVGPRDGLQNERTVLPTYLRADLVNRLAAAGLTRIEAVSFVNPERVPAMAGAEEVVAGIERRDGTVYGGLVLNAKGYDRLATTTLDRVHFAFAVTETFNQRNQRATPLESIEVAKEIIARAKPDGRAVSVTLGATFGCPFEGAVDPGVVLDYAARLVEAGADEVIFADTIGVAVPRQVKEVVERGVTLGAPVGVHLHNTRNTGYANAWVALEAGAQSLDASIGGLGGCPFAPRATGNIATEDLIYMLEGAGIDTGLDLDALIDTASWLSRMMVKDLPGQLYRVGPFRPALADAGAVKA